WHGCDRRICAAEMRATASRPRDWALLARAGSRAGCAPFPRRSARRACVACASARAARRAGPPARPLPYRSPSLSRTEPPPTRAPPAEKVRHGGLEGSVAPAVQHQLWIAAEQARCIDAQRKLRGDAVAGITLDRCLRVAVEPAAFHRRAPVMRTQAVATRRRDADGQARFEARTGVALAERTLAPPSGTARTIGLALCRTRHDRLDRRRDGRREGRREGWCRRAFIITPSLRRWLTHGRTAPRRRFGRRGFGAREMCNWRRLCLLRRDLSPR